MRDPIAPVLGSIRQDAPIVERADAGLLFDALLAPAARWIDHATIDEFVEDLGVSGVATADIGELWTFDELSTASGVAGKNGTTLTPAVSAAVSIVGQRAVGLFNGIDFRSFRAVEVADDGAGFYASSDAPISPGSADFALIYAFRVAQRSSIQTSLIGHTTHSHGAGFCLYLEADGTLTWRVRGPSGDRTRTLAGNHADGAWHFVVMGKRTSEGTTSIRLFSDLTDVTSTSGAIGSVNATGFPFAVGDVHGGTFGAFQQAKLAAYLTGAAAVNIMDMTAVRAWWSKRVTAGPPSVGYARTSSLSSQVGIDEDGGPVIGVVGLNAPAHLYMPSEDGAFGMQFTPAFTSIVPSSNPADWSDVDDPDVTNQYADIDDPRGVRHAVMLGKTGGNPTGRKTITVALTNAVVYHFAVFAWSLQSVSEPILRLRNAADDTTIASATLPSSTAERWGQIVLTVTAPSTGNFELQLLGSSEGDDEGWALFQYVSGGVGGSVHPIPALALGGTTTIGAAAMLVDPGGAGLIGRANAGKLEVTAIMQGAIATLPAERGLASLSNGSNARRLSVRTTRNLRGTILDDAGGTDLTVEANLTTDELGEVHRWGMEWANDVNPTAIVTKDGVELEDDSTPIDDATDPNGLIIGTTSFAGAPWLGGISRVRIWSRGSF